MFWLGYLTQYNNEKDDKNGENKHIRCGAFDGD